nr:MAG TPA: hypothetical protein [Bacteriophage sp.]
MAIFYSMSILFSTEFTISARLAGSPLDLFGSVASLIY